ncbi:hypothetical protein SDC9_155257 [bioreactor metagenome]|uniref:Uncharacterized protein n=1 Tax=bioreactor metagenome TaxID=1076179 RepID=A0A645F126_9ZZZZ
MVSVMEAAANTMSSTGSAAGASAAGASAGSAASGAGAGSTAGWDAHPAAKTSISKATRTEMAFFIVFLLKLFFMFYRYLPKGQMGYRQGLQPKHSPPLPMAAMSARVMGTLANIRGSSKSNTVAPAYITQPGKPRMGRPSSK